MYTHVNTLELDHGVATIIFNARPPSEKPVKLKDAFF